MLKTTLTSAIWKYKPLNVADISETIGCGYRTFLHHSNFTIIFHYLVYECFAYVLLTLLCTRKILHPKPQWQEGLCCQTSRANANFREWSPYLCPRIFSQQEKKTDLCTFSSLPALILLCHSLQIQLFYRLYRHMTCVIQCDVFSAPPLRKYTPERGRIFKIVLIQIYFPWNIAYSGNFNCSVALLMMRAYVYILFSCFDSICYICDLRLMNCPNLNRWILIQTFFVLFLIYYTIFKQSLGSFIW